MGHKAVMTTYICNVSNAFGTGTASTVVREVLQEKMSLEDEELSEEPSGVGDNQLTASI